MHLSKRTFLTAGSLAVAGGVRAGQGEKELSRHMERCGMAKTPIARGLSCASSGSYRATFF